MKCCTVRDLLPLYAEQLTSPETGADLSKHLELCPACAALYAEMQQTPAETIAAPDDINPLRTVRHNSRKKTVIAAIAAAVAGFLFMLLFRLFFITGTLLRSDQITMKIETYWEDYDESRPQQLRRYFTYEEAEAAMKEPDAGTMHEMVSVVLECDCLSIRNEITGTRLTRETDSSMLYLPDISDISLYSVLMPPLALDSHMLRHVSLWSRMSHHGPAAEGSVMMIRCKDGSFAYTLTGLAALADASPDHTATLRVGEKLPITE